MSDGHEEVRRLSVPPRVRRRYARPELRLLPPKFLPLTREAEERVVSILADLLLEDMNARRTAKDYDDEERLCA